MAYNKRINDEDLPGNYVDGSVLLHTDMNKLETLTREGINANYEDIQKLQDGTTVIGYAATAGSAETSSALDSATLSTYSEETLQNNDAKVPTSKQVKEYVDDAVSGLTTDYPDLTNKPSINGVTLVGNKTSADLGIFDDIPLYYFDGINNAANVAMINEICTRYDNGEEVHFVGKFADGELNQVFEAPINITKYSTGDDNWASFISDPIPWLDHTTTPAKVRYCSYALNLIGTWGNYTAVSEYRLDDFVPLTAETDPVFSASVAAGITASDITKWNNAEENVQSDWSQSDNTKDDFIKNKPNIPTVNDATLTIQKNSTTIDTFTANASSDKTINITVPTKTSDLTNDGSSSYDGYKYAKSKKSSQYSGSFVFPGGTLELDLADDKHLEYLLEDSSSTFPLMYIYKIALAEELTAKDTLPTANSYYLGKVYQYTGTTNANYTHGYFYQCVSDGAVSPTYSWERINVQPGTVDYGDLTNKPSINSVTLSGNKTSSDLGVQDTLVSGTNIKTINSQSILGSGDITIGGAVSDVQVGGTSILSSGVANLITKGTYNASTNKIATMADVPSVPNIVILTESEYNALTTYADNTEYHIIEG